MALVPPTTADREPAVVVFVWQLELDPEFPLAVLDYRTGDGEDRMHWHDHVEIALVTGGRGRFLFGRREQPAEPGDVFFIDNSKPHVAVSGGAEPLRLLLVLFRAELLAGPGCRAFESAYLSPFRADERAFSGRVPGGTALAAEIAAALHVLDDTYARHDPADRHLLDACLRRVLGLVIQDRAWDGCADRSAADRRGQIRPVLAYVESHCREGVTLDAIAELVHVSPSRVRHVFKDVTGVGFKEYVTNVRVAEAKRLLLGTDLSVAEVARTVSYTNLHQFYRVFRRSCAMSPGEYRRYYARVAPDGPGSTASGTGGHEAAAAAGLPVAR